MQDQPVVHLSDPFDALPEPQRSSCRKLKTFLDALRKRKPPSKNGDVFVGDVDARGNCIVQMFVREGLFEARTIQIECPILHWDYSKFVNRLRMEWEALHGALFLNTYAPDLYVDDVSGVSVKESRTVKSMDLM